MDEFEFKENVGYGENPFEGLTMVTDDEFLDCSLERLHERRALTEDGEYYVYSEEAAKDLYEDGIATS